MWLLLAFVSATFLGLYDKFIMKELGAMFVQSWFNLYQMFM